MTSVKIDDFDVNITARGVVKSTEALLHDLQHNTISYSHWEEVIKQLKIHVLGVHKLLEKNKDEG